MHAPIRTVAPTESPVSLDEAKTHLRVDAADDDTLILGLIDAAVAELDGYGGLLGKALVTQTWAQAFDGFASRLRLPLAAVSVSSVTYLNASDAAQTLPADQYALERDHIGSYLAPAPGVAWPSARRVTVTFVCGSAPADIDARFKARILLRISDLYHNREATTSAQESLMGGLGIRV